MGILSDRDIRWQLDHGHLVVDPLYEPMQPASIDLRLGNQIILPKGGHIIDPQENLGTTDSPRPWNMHVLTPGEFVLGSTLEYVQIPPHLVGHLEGKSSLARFGLQIECAGYVDPGWRGRLTLEIKNLGLDIIILRPGMLICQIRFEMMIAGDRPGRPERLYGDPALNSHYQGAETVQVGQLGAPPSLPQSDRRTGYVP